MHLICLHSNSRFPRLSVFIPLFPTLHPKSWIASTSPSRYEQKITNAWTPLILAYLLLLSLGEKNPTPEDASGHPLNQPITDCSIYFILNSLALFIIFRKLLPLPRRFIFVPSPRNIPSRGKCTSNASQKFFFTPLSSSIILFIKIIIFHLEKVGSTQNVELFVNYLITSDGKKKLYVLYIIEMSFAAVKFGRGGEWETLLFKILVFLSYVQQCNPLHLGRFAEIIFCFSVCQGGYFFISKGIAKLRLLQTLFHPL